MMQHVPVMLNISTLNSTGNLFQLHPEPAEAAQGLCRLQTVPASVFKALLVSIKISPFSIPSSAPSGPGAQVGSPAFNDHIPLLAVGSGKDSPFLQTPSNYSFSHFTELKLRLSRRAALDIRHLDKNHRCASDDCICFSYFWCNIQRWNVHSSAAAWCMSCTNIWNLCFSLWEKSFGSLGREHYAWSTDTDCPSHSYLCCHCFCAMSKVDGQWLTDIRPVNLLLRKNVTPFLPSPRACFTSDAKNVCWPQMYRL